MHERPSLAREDLPVGGYLKPYPRASQRVPSKNMCFVNALAGILSGVVSTRVN